MKLNHEIICNAYIKSIRISQPTTGLINEILLGLDGLVINTIFSITYMNHLAIIGWQVARVSYDT